MNYYEVLGLPITASTADIRQAYRQLVLLTHPDRTPDPAAHARYLDINAAYEVLSDPTQRAAYDNGFNGSFSQPIPSTSPGRARDEARRRTRARHPRPVAVPLTVRYAAEYALSLRIAKPFLLLALLLTAGLVMDYVLATERLETIVESEMIIYYTGSRRNRESHEYYRHSTARGTLDTDDNIPVGTSLLIKRSPMWSNVTAVSYDGTTVEFRPTYSSFNSALLLLLAGLSWFALRPTYNDDHRLTAAMLAVVLLCTVVYRMIL